jgi:phage terminase small subunit
MKPVIKSPLRPSSTPQRREVSKSRLTAKQEAFCLAYTKTGNASEAYRQAYDANNMSAAAIEVEASRLLHNPKVTLRLDRVQERQEVKALLCLEEHMEELRVLRDMAKSNSQLSAAIQAEVKRGELRRFYVKQVESAHINQFSRMTDEELEAFIRDKAPAALNGKPTH